MSFWNNVETLRKKQNTSYRWLAEKMAVSETTVSSMRHAGTEPRATEAVRIAAALNTTVEYLVTGISSNPAETELAQLKQKLLELTKSG